MRHKIKKGEIVKGSIATLVGLVIVFPIFYALSASFFSVQDFAVYPPQILPKALSFHNYLRAFRESLLFRFMLNSLFISVIGSVLRMEVLFSEDFGSSKIIVGGANIDDATFGDAFMNAPLTYRATVDFNLGRFLIGANYTIDSGGFTFENLDAEKLMPDFDNNKGTFGVSALFRIF
jgi:hypothetical protein